VIGWKNIPKKENPCDLHQTKKEKILQKIEKLQLFF